MKKLNKVEKLLVRHTWEAWSKYAEACWLAVMDIPAQTKTYFQICDAYRSDTHCQCELHHWHGLYELCEAAGINYVEYSAQDERTSKASQTYDMYQNLLWKHSLRE